MSGPKVVRIVTREEILAICEAHLNQLEKALARWQAAASKLGELTEAQYAVTRARHERLRALLKDDMFAELQKSVPVEIEYLKRDLGEREERAIIRATEKRQRLRRVHENAAVLLQALHAKKDLVSPELLRSLASLAKGASHNDAEALLAQGFSLLTAAVHNESLTNDQRELAQRLKADEPALSFAGWVAVQHQDAPREERLQRIDRHIAELQMLQGPDTATVFLEKLLKAEIETRAQERNMLLDSLVLDLAQATRLYQQQRASFNQLQDLASEVAALKDPAQDTLLEEIANCENNKDLQQMATLTDQCNKIIAAQLQAYAASARRQVVLEGLASLGYEVREGMSTAWAETGRVALRKTATPGFGVEVSGKAENGRLQVRAVALNSNHDKQRDRDIETIWCGEFHRLQTLLTSQGNEILIEKALGVGEVELKVVALEEELLAASSPTQKSLR